MITCHDNEMHILGMEKDEWRPPDIHREPYGEPFRTCSYCGSIHPEDLLRFLQQGATLESVDWKYGWPHKFYIDGIPNPQAGKRVKIGSRSGPGYDEDIYGTGSESVHAKFYSVHLQDAEADLSHEIRQQLVRQTGVYLAFRDGEVRYALVAADFEVPLE